MKLEEEVPHPVFVDFKPNRLLLDPNFNGYKLSLDSLPSYIAPLKKGVDRVGPTDDQYSIQHAKLFALHNCLNSDPWNPSLFFVVDEDWNVCKINFETETRKFDDPIEVWTIPTKLSRKTGRYNVTLTFPHENYVVLADGCGSLFVLDTGNRKECTRWKASNQFNFVEEPTILDQFVIMDSVLYQSNQKTVIDVLLVRIRDRTEKNLADFLETHENQFIKAAVNHPFITTLDWISIQNNGAGNWNLKSTRSLMGPSGVEYACIEPGGKGIIVASENHFAFSHISDEPLRYAASRHTKSKLDNIENKPDYLWMQNAREITVWFKIPIGAKKNDINVDIKISSISLMFNGKVMLEGEFLNPVKADESVWTIAPASWLPIPDESNSETDNIKTFQCLEIILQKVEQDLEWKGESFVKGDLSGQQLLDPELAKEIHERLGHLCSDKWDADPLRASVFDPQQLEECDSFPADTTAIMRIDRHMQCITHMASLGSHQWLFTAQMQLGKVPAICIRHDVDGLVWQPCNASLPQTCEDIGTWKLDHIGTFSAMGYVQASKQQRKFTVCPPDLSYVAICDAIKHVYIYRQPSAITTDLRNRRTGEHVSHIAKQQIMSVDPPLEVLGAFASNNHLHILTTKNCHAVTIKVSDP